MLNRKIITTLLIITLVFSNMSLVFADESTPVNTDSAVETENDDNKDTTDEAVDENEDKGSSAEETVQIVNSISQIMSIKATATHYVKCMDSKGKKTTITAYNSAADANTAMNDMYSGKLTTYGNYKSNKGLVVTDTSDKIVNMKVGMAYFKSSASTVTVGNTYITPKDALHFYGTATTLNSKCTVGINGAKASIATSKLILVPGSIVNVSGFYTKDYYTKNSSGDLLHYVYKIKSPTTSTPYTSGKGCTGSAAKHVIDKAPSWMTKDKKYYSNDGINYYTDIALSSKAGTHYAYFQFLPYRSMSNYTATSLNSWISKNTSSTSKLKNQGRNLINAQNRYGANAVNELAFACLESAYGSSSFAKNRNNLFGINAVDSNPNNATSFKTVKSCINQHAKYYISRGYGNAKSDYRYFGLSPGNKTVGMNVKYASDPWHGEKISGIAYQIDKYLGSSDHGKYTIGVTNKNSVNVYKSAGSTYMYNLSTKSTGSGPTGIPVVILGSSGDYYQIQSDLPVSSNTASHTITYYFNKSVTYVKKSDLTVIRTGSKNYGNTIASNNKLRNITVKVGSKNYLTGFNPDKTSYTVKVPKTTNSVAIKASPLMTSGKVSGNGTKVINKQTKSYNIKSTSSSGSSKTYKIKVEPKGASAFTFGIYNSKTKLTNKSKKGTKTTSKNPMNIKTKVKTNSNKTKVQMVIYNGNKKVVAKKTQYIYKTKTVKFTWNGKYTKHNKLGKKAGKYAKRSSKGVTYYVRFIASRKGVATDYGDYHKFYLYK